MLEQGFLAFINEHQLVSTQQSVLIAVSGGVDSMVLTHLMHRCGFTFAMAHVNFGLRGTESDADALLVKNKAAAYGVPFHEIGFDTAAEARRRGESIQLVARHLRYNWFQTLRQEHGYAAIATAHHLNDVLETMLLNLTRGTGLAGLHGIPVKTDQGVIRPLWFATRADIEAYAQEQQLTWRDDASNASDTYSRNRIRHQVVPALEHINPGLLQTLPRTISQIQAAEKILNAELDWSFAACTEADNLGYSIDCQQLAQLPEPLYRLNQWLRPYGFTPDMLAQCWRGVDQRGAATVKTGQVFRTDSHQLTHHQDRLWLRPRHPTPHTLICVNDWPAEPLDLGQAGQLTVTPLHRDNWSGTWPDSPNEALFDAAMLPFPWLIRPWKQGDRFRPLGMTGSKLVSDLLQERHMPLPDREHVWVLESAGMICWVLGLRMAHVARLTSESRHLINCRLQNQNFQFGTHFDTFIRETHS
ncbi:tRNA lysidine(34) synthetase TilS [Fibrella sp. HMF5335]|uniref:tRNA(Ile)-lysidine synthase n=1 Tax=Fibrella rubiginis TaxID=2817060 RepID=A0A939K6A3_9BACT|nr:tRNA lysidine(34) synthetase TilS [Fibrella rubiginis]MBO0938633.1 tRNA lysidine(34) synthetase TilS [Fibrella rubiginis]